MDIKRDCLPELRKMLGFFPVVGILGARQVGKTTLAKLICRLYKTTGGDILVNDVNVDDININSWYQNLGVLYQEYPTYPQLSVRDNVIIADPARAVYDHWLR